MSELNEYRKLTKHLDHLENKHVKIRRGAIQYSMYMSRKVKDQASEIRLLKERDSFKGELLRSKTKQIIDQGQTLARIQILRLRSKLEVQMLTQTDNEAFHETQGLIEKWKLSLHAYERILLDFNRGEAIPDNLGFGENEV